MVTHTTYPYPVSSHEQQYVDGGFRLVSLPREWPAGFPPSVFKPSKGKLEIRTGMSGRRWFGDALAKSVPDGSHSPVWQPESRCWTVAPTHLYRIVGAMLTHWSEVDLFVDANSIMLCTESCVEAKGDACVCICGGLNHQGRECPDYWVDKGSLLIGVTQLPRHWRRATQKSEALA